MYNINIPGIPDLSNLDLSQFNIPGIAPPPEQQAPAQEQQALTPAFEPPPVYDNPLPQLDFSNIDLSQFNLPNQPPPAMVAPPPEVVPAPVAPAPQFDPYAGMTQADLAEIGMMLPRTQPPAPAPAPAPMPQPVAPSGIEGLAPNFRLTEDFMLPATAPETPPVPSEVYVGPEDYTEGKTDIPDVSSVAQGLVSNIVTLPNGETIDLSGINLGNLDLESFGVNPNIAAEAAAEAQGTTPNTTPGTTPGRGNINPEDYYVPASDFYTDGQLADAGIEPGTAVSPGAGLTFGGPSQINLTPEQQAAIDAFVANNPAGSIVGTPFGNISLPDLSQYTGGNTGPSTNAAAAQYVIQNLVPQASETARGGSVATTFGAPVGIPQPPSRENPFRRPTDDGIASLVPSGG